MGFPGLQVRLIIKGRVQGVFYRNWTVENATHYRRDGSVEALFSGDSDYVTGNVAEVPPWPTSSCGYWLQDTLCLGEGPTIKWLILGSQSGHQSSRKHAENPDAADLEDTIDADLKDMADHEEIHANIMFPYLSFYYTKLKGLWDELSAYSTVPSCSCGAGKQILAERETEKVHQFLMGLNDQYGIIRSQILNMEPFPSINKAYAFVTKEEKQLAIAGISRDQLTEAAAFNVKHNRFPTKNFAGEQQRGEPSKFTTKDFAADQQRGETSRFRCSYCDKPGHSKEKCFKLVGYPSSWQNKAKTLNFARQNRNFRREPEHNVANFVGKVTHSADTTDWILDSEASEHLTCDSLYQFLIPWKRKHAENPDAADLEDTIDADLKDMADHEEIHANIMFPYLS
ncbi:hypothetical protein DKX38_009691 [Salix brachista]|uniref:Acylphosphatase-like domain-containing protein n=1 Tax=Salix brachista TaxID=2182728 RepID=A0A5N5MB53_9ROSI|nr:hypothetical protein DKX38_009691 [Salix brachista]